MHAVWNDRTNVVASRMLASSGQLFWRCVNRSQTRFLAAWRYASAVSATALCPSVRHRPVLYRNCWIYWTHSCTYTLCYNEIRASRKVRALPCSYPNSVPKIVTARFLNLLRPTNAATLAHWASTFVYNTRDVTQRGSVCSSWHLFHFPSSRKLLLVDWDQLFQFTDWMLLCL